MVQADQAGFMHPDKIIFTRQFLELDQRFGYQQRLFAGKIEVGVIDLSLAPDDGFVSSKVGKKFKDTNKHLFNGRYDLLNVM